MQLTYRNDRFEAISRYEEKDAIKAAGFWWDSAGKVWYAVNTVQALKFKGVADEGAKKKLAELEAKVESSKAAETEIELPKPEGLNYLGYQKAGILYAVNNKKNTLFADEMGLGKTIQALGFINVQESIKSVLVVCPASLKLNWKREAEKWLVRKMSIGVGSSKELPTADMVILNYDVLVKHLEALKVREWDLLIADEAHYAKNPKAKRSKSLYGIPAKTKLYLTGTPILNKPIELWPILNSLDKGTWGNFWYYAKRYCDAHKEVIFRGKEAWNLNGASNLDELQMKLRGSVMVRRLKSEVLKELPPKVRQVIEIPANGCSRAVEEEKRAFENVQEQLEQLHARVELAKASDREEDYFEAVRSLREGEMAAFAELSKLRHETALAKVPTVIEHVRDTLENVNKLVVFCHHKDVVEAIHKEFEGSVVVTGDTKIEDRQAAVDKFQSDPGTRLFIGTIGAAGLGITLTAASTVIFAELDWVPARITQAEDRCHRIGQQESVLIQHLVLEGSLDAHMARIVIDKQEMIARALDKEVDFSDDPLISELMKKAATKEVTRKRIEGEVAAMTEEMRVDIHAALRQVAGVCDGAARKDGEGFNRIDTRIGKSLAGQSMLSVRQAVLAKHFIFKYRRQIDSELYGRMFPGAEA